MALTREDLAALMDAFEASPYSEMVATIDGTRVELTRSGEPPVSGGVPSPVPAAPNVQGLPGGGSAGTFDAGPAPAPSTVPSGPVALAEGELAITSPSVGIFYRAPDPAAPPFVEVGGRVEPDDVVCIVEVMKLMNHVKAGVAGTVTAVHADNAAMVEHGTVLFSVAAD